VLLSVCLFAIDQRNPSQLASIRITLSVPLYPLRMLVSFSANLSSQLLGSLNSFSSYEELREENKLLKKNQLVYKTKLLKFASLEKENVRLRALVEKSFNLGEQVLIAELISVNLVPYEHTIVVNKGSRFGVHIKQSVFDANGVVGQVIRSEPLNAEIMLITDPSHAIPVQINRNGLRTIAVGTGQINRLSLPFLPNNADIHPGDLLITSGLGGTFPQGYPVAVVDTFEPQLDKAFANIYATPSALLNRSRELLIVWSNTQPIPFIKPVKSIAPLDNQEKAIEIPATQALTPETHAPE